MSTVQDRIQQVVDKQYDGKAVELARRSGVRPSTLNDVLAGKNNPSYDTLRRIVETGVNAEWLLTGGQTQESDKIEKLKEVIRKQQNTINCLLP